MSKNTVPFAKGDQLITSLDSLLEMDHQAGDERLPGYPSMHLHDVGSLRTFLTEDLYTTELDTMAPVLWMMTTQSSANISPIHAQKVKTREIVISEHPRLHLAWTHNRVFIKPLPKYLLSFAFWDKYLVDRSSPLQGEREMLCRAAKGFLRTYYHLVKYESDFDMAQSARLIPSSVTWEAFSSFISEARFIYDDDVSPRYCYGELRLTRLNFYAKFFLRRFRYEWGRPQYSTYFNRFYPHLLFVFALLSILLNSMQVELAVESLTPHPWVPVWNISRYFSSICLVGIVLTIFCCIAVPMGLFIDEWIYAIRMRKKPSVSVP